MKIIKTSDDAIKEKAARAKANEGCSICPCCGNSKLVKPFEKPLSQIEQNDGIVMYTYGAEDFWKIGKIDSYTCNKCGAQWESEIY